MDKIKDEWLLGAVRVQRGENMEHPLFLRH
jgi:hypothetical protein